MNIMQIMILLISLFVFVFVIMLGYKKGKEIDRKDRKIQYIEGKKKQTVREKKLDESFSERFIMPKLKMFTQMANNSQTNKQSGKYKIVEKQLRLAGMNMTADTYLFYKQAFMVLAVILSVFAAIVTKQILVMAGGLAVALLVPNQFLSGKAKSHQQGIREQLPDAMDLLCICIEAGLSFDASLVKVSEKMQGPFIDELLKLYRQIQMGVPRTEALRAMANGSEIPELKTFMAALAQATQLGIPVNNIMRVQSETLRQTRMELAREKGQKAPVKMLIPMVGLIFPVLFIVILAPVVLQAMAIFSGK